RGKVDGGPFVKRLFVGVIAAAGAIAILTLSAVVFGHRPAELLSILISGSIGSQFALQGTIIKSVPLLLTGLSVVIAFRAGVWNIGAEGQFIVGALAAFSFAQFGMTASLIASIVAG